MVWYCILYERSFLSKHDVFFSIVLNPRHPGPVLPVTQAEQTSKTPNLSLATMTLYAGPVVRDLCLDKWAVPTNIE